ncbi:unnamed protein product [Urochloa humidicola]
MRPREEGRGVALRGRPPKKRRPPPADGGGGGKDEDDTEQDCDLSYNEALRTAKKAETRRCKEQCYCKKFKGKG